MELISDNGTATFRICAYSPQLITVNEAQLVSSFILSPEKIISPWPVTSIAELTDTHVQSILALQPDLVLLGSGDTLQFPAPALLANFYKKNVGVEIMTNAAACRTYNLLMAEGRQVVAAFILPPA